MLLRLHMPLAKIVTELLKAGPKTATFASIKLFWGCSRTSKSAESIKKIIIKFWKGLAKLRGAEKKD